MGQTLSTLGGMVGYKHEHRTGTDGVVDSLVTFLDISILKRKIKLQFTIVHEPQEEGDDVAAFAAGSAGAAAAIAPIDEDKEAPPRLNLIQEAVDDESIQPPADDDHQEEADHDLPPLAFVDEVDDSSSSTSSTKRYPKSRRAFSMRTSTDETKNNTTTTPSRQSRRGARPQSVGALSSGTGGRLSVQTVSDVVAIMGRDGQRRMMNRVRLSMHDQEEVILIPVGPSSREKEEEGREGGVGGLGGEGEDNEDEIRAQRPRRCQSVMVSLEAGEQLAEEEKAWGEKKGEEMEEGDEDEGKEGKEGGREDEEKLSLEIEQVEGFRPLGHMTHDAAAAVVTVTTNAELEAAVLRLCSAYSKDETSPTVVSHKRDIKIITGFLSRLILPAGQNNSSSSSSSSSSSISSSNKPSSSFSCVADILPADMTLLTPEPASPPSSPSSPSTSSTSHTLIPPLPLSPYAYEPSIEKSSGGSTAAATTAAAATAATGKTSIKPSASFFLKNNETDKQEEQKSASQAGSSSNASAPPPKPKRHRKIRLSASSFEQLQVSADDNGALFDDLWDVQPATASSTSSSSSSSSPFSALRKLVKPSPARVTRKGHILPPDDDEVEEGEAERRRGLIPDDECL